MKCLSIRPAWAFLIINLPGPHWKRVENRSWATTYRGPLLIHASLGLTKGEHEEACELAREAGAKLADLPTFQTVAATRGGIIGAVRLIEVSKPGYAIEGDENNPWRDPDSFGWHLADRVALPFRQCLGALGVRDRAVLPAESAALLAAGLNP